MLLAPQFWKGHLLFSFIPGSCIHIQSFPSGSCCFSNCRLIFCYNAIKTTQPLPTLLSSLTKPTPYLSSIFNQKTIETPQRGSICLHTDHKYVFCYSHTTGYRGALLLNLWRYLDINALSFQIQRTNEGLLKPSRTWRSISNPTGRQNLLWLITFFYILWVLTTGNIFKLASQDVTLSFIPESDSPLRRHVTLTMKGIGSEKKNVISATNRRLKKLSLN